MSGAFYELLGEAIRRRREAIGMTQATLASRAVVLRTTVTNIERGRQAVLVHQLVDIANALGTTVANLLVTERPPINVSQGEGVSDQIQTLLGKLNARGQRGRVA